MPKYERYDCIIVGGGFFGLYIGEFYALSGKKVLICEKAPTCMTRASYNNQARVHSGYHYPRSILTAIRSCVSFPQFIKEFDSAIKSNFTKYYAIGKILGKINASQFEEFCNRIEAPCELVSPKISKMFSPQYIEAVFQTREYAFDAAILRSIMLERYKAAGGELEVNCTVSSVAKPGNELKVTMSCSSSDIILTASEVYNCTYSNINFINTNSKIELIPLKHEMTEMALVEVPEELENVGITVMCGPFFSLMPFPDKGMYTFSHVRYTPHYEWYDQDAANYCSPHTIYDLDKKNSAFVSMKNDSARYLPAIKNCAYKDSLWEVKTVLPASEVDDSRPILFKPNYHLKGYHCVMGGKIDNVYDVITAIKSLQA